MSIEHSLKVVHVVGARPNFVKAAPVLRALSRCNARQTLVHTGQHYDASMSDTIFSQLGMQKPEVNLCVGSGSHATQTAEIMLRLEPVILERQPNVVLVYGDVNSTLAAALVCSKLLIPVAHVEAGLRSWDSTMPEEVNRILTDHVSEFLFTASEDGDRNLLHEGISADKIHRVGNVMIDSLIAVPPATAHRGHLERYALVTLHRPCNVDDPAVLKEILRALCEISEDMKILFPMHPRTRKRIAEFAPEIESLHFLDPLPYVEFVALEQRATVVITDSGGVQEETTYLNVPCLTLRNSTERPVTVSMGSNVLIGQNWSRLRGEVWKILRGEAKQATIPPLWDGHAADRIAEILLNTFHRNHLENRFCSAGGSCCFA